MIGDDCSDCGLPHHVHFREDGLYGCPVDTPISYPTNGAHQEPTGIHSNSYHATVTCPNAHDTSNERVARSESPDPLLLAPDKQLPQRYSSTQRRSIHFVDAPAPLRRSFRLENRHRVREVAGPYSQSQVRRSSLKTSRDTFRRSCPRRASLQDSRRPSGRSCGNEEQNRPPERFRRASLQPHVLEHIVPVEDMEVIEGFQPFTELEPEQHMEPVTLREPMKKPQQTAFHFVWKPSITFPEVGGMRVRVGQFERMGHRTEDAMPLAWPCTSDGNDSSSSGSSSEGYFTAQDWTPSFTPHQPSTDVYMHCADPLPSQPQPDFIQGSSKPVPPPQTWAGCGTCPPFVAKQDVDFPQLGPLAQHYAAVHEMSMPVTPPAPALCPPIDPRHSEGLTMPPPHDQATLAQQGASAPPRPIMPGTLPGTQITDYYYLSDSESVPPPPPPSMGGPDRVTEAAVDEREDWATREPWEYVHRVLTSSTYPLVMFLKTPTADIPAAALGVLGADLRLQKMLVDNEHWLLVGPPGVDLHEFGVRFQTRARTPEKFVFRFGNLNWGADVNQIEDEVCKATIEGSMRGRGLPAMLPAQFMAGAVGGLVVWYALSLM